MTLGWLFEIGPSILLCALCLIASLLFKKNDWKFRWLFIHLFVVFIIEAISMVLNIFSVPNTFLYHIYIVEEFVLLALFYRAWFRSSLLQKSVVVMIFVFLIFSILNSLIFQKSQVFNSNARVVESIILTLLSIVTFINLFQSSDNVRLVQHPLFWFNCAILLYFTSSLILFLLSNLLLEKSSAKFNGYVWDFHRWLALVYYSIIGIGLWKIKAIKS